MHSFSADCVMSNQQLSGCWVACSIRSSLAVSTDKQAVHTAHTCHLWLPLPTVSWLAMMLQSLLLTAHEALHEAELRHCS